ncbi:MAG: UDP-N-acetylmuramoyl-L-alanine--D-glutamate ligase [Alphaproteobacteria bacterium]
MPMKLNKKFYILGLGLSGLSVALFLKKINGEIICWDDDIKKRKIAEKKKLIVTKLSKNNFDEIDIIIVSPGINHRNFLKKNLSKIQLNTKKFTTDIELIELLKLKNFLIGITGTNGKSSTTKFLSQSLNSQKIKAKECGNIGIPVTDVIDKINKNDILVIEASSYQLDKINNLKFDIAVLLNISSDHIEWHGNIKNYIQAKSKIFLNQKKNCYGIICVDDKYCEEIARNFKKKFSSTLIKISTKKEIQDGIYLRKLKNNLEIYNKITNEKISLDLKKLKITGVEHNFQNLLAIYTVNFILKNNSFNFLNSLKKLSNLEHRIEFIGKYKNIRFYNDSKATNAISAKNAIQSFENIFWILGGVKKEGGLKGIESSFKSVLLAFNFGQSKYEFHNFLKNNGVKSFVFEDLKHATINAVNYAMNEKKEINIILSPACASFDQFQSFEDRGNSFKKIIHKIISNDQN